MTKPKGQLNKGACTMNRHLRPALESLEGKNLMTASTGFFYSLAAVPVGPINAQQVDLTLTVTNTSRQVEYVNTSSLMNSFVAIQNGKDVWSSGLGIKPFSISVIALAPGQSHQVTEVWNEVDNIPGPSNGKLISGPVTFENLADPTHNVTITLPNTRTRPF
jgi:hypothetical protein